MDKNNFHRGNINEIVEKILLEIDFRNCGARKLDTILNKIVEEMAILKS